MSTCSRSQSVLARASWDFCIHFSFPSVGMQSLTLQPEWYVCVRMFIFSGFQTHHGDDPAWVVPVLVGELEAPSDTHNTGCALWHVLQC